MRDDRGSIGPARTIAICVVVLIVVVSAWVGWLIAGQVDAASTVATLLCAGLLIAVFALLARVGTLRVQVNLPRWLRRAEEASLPEPKRSDAVRRVLELSGEEARHFRQERIGTEHLLLGIMREGGEGTRALSSRGVTLEALIRSVDTVSGVGSAAEGTEPTLSLPARRAMENAGVLARAQRSRSVQVRHLLIALAQEHGGVAAGILEHFGCTAATLQTAFGASRH
jgi:hypothetical protein